MTNGLSGEIVVNPSDPLMFSRSQPGSLPAVPAKSLTSNVYLPPLLNVVLPAFIVPGLLPGEISPPVFTVSAPTVSVPFNVPPLFTLTAPEIVPEPLTVAPELIATAPLPVPDVPAPELLTTSVPALTTVPPA